MKIKKQWFMAGVAALLLCMGMGCKVVDVHVIDAGVDSPTMIGLESDSRTIARPMSLSSDGKGVYLLGRPEAGLLTIDGYSFTNSQKRTRIKMPLLTDAVGSPNTALSPNAKYFSYMGLREVSSTGVILGGLYSYDGIHTNVITIYDPSRSPSEINYTNRVPLYNASGLPGFVLEKYIQRYWCDGDTFWLDTNRLLMVSHSGPTEAYILHVPDGREESLIAFDGETSTLHPFLSPKTSRVVFKRTAIREPDQLVIYDLIKKRVVGQIKTSEHIGFNVGWDGEDVLYYSAGGKIYRWQIGSNQQEVVCDIGKQYRVDVYGVDSLWRVHFSYEKSESWSKDWAGYGWCMCDPKTGKWEKLFGLHYIRDVVRSRDGRYFVVSAGM